MKNIKKVLVASLFLGGSWVVSAQKYPYKNAKLPVEERIKDLMGRMTLEDKAAQMAQYVGLEHMKMSEKKLTVEQMKKSDAFGFYEGLNSDGVAKLITEGKTSSFLHVVTAEEANYLQSLALKSKLQIPLLIGIDAIHGNGLYNGATIYPSPITLAAAFDDNLAYKVGRESAVEMRATGSQWAFTPNIDVLRDPRWGRTGETFGEDPYHVGNLGVAMIKGFQGNDFTGTDKVIANAKHLIAGSESLNGLNLAPTDISERTVWEIFLPPYKRAVREANIFSIMTAHNELNGIPAHMHKGLMTDILRNTFGFKGFYVSDWNDVERISSVHKVAKDYKEATLLSVNAGMDMNMHGPKFQDYVVELVNEGKMPVERVNDAVSKILEAKFKLGLFENPLVDLKKKDKSVFTKEHQATALDAARKSIVLQKNNGVLPLKNVKKIFISGPNADNQTLMGDWVSPQPEDRFISIVEGMTALAKQKGAEIKYTPVNYHSKKITDAEISAAAKDASNADVAVLVLGENSFRHEWESKTTGENIDRSTLALSGKQKQLYDAVKATGKPVVVVYVSGSPIAEPQIEETAAATVNAWEPGSFGGQAVAEVLFGEVNPGGKLPLTIPRTVGQLQMVYNYKPSMYFHKYHDEKKVPLYPFGYGLSYTKFDISEPTVSSKTYNGTGTITVTAMVKNSGAVAGDEVVQMYIRDNFSSVTRPVKEMKGYERVSLKPGESKTVTFSIDAEKLAFFDMDFNYIVEPGDFTVMVGNSSADKDLKKTTFNVTQKINLKK